MSPRVSIDNITLVTGVLTQWTTLDKLHTANIGGFSLNNNNDYTTGVCQYFIPYLILIQHLYKKSGKSRDFHLPVMFKVMHVMSSYISQNVHRTMKVLASISSALSTFSMGVYQTPNFFA